jgi:hypothetical protein
MPEARELEQQAFSVAEFCLRNRISPTTFHKLKREGRGPRVMWLGAAQRISREAEADWRRAREAEAASQDAELERQRRQEFTSRIGKLAAASPSHVSKRRKGRKPGQ